LAGWQEGPPACKKLGGYGCGGAVSSVGVASTQTISASASIKFPCSTKKSRRTAEKCNNSGISEAVWLIFTKVGMKMENRSHVK